jgi:hypothetical protein
LVLLTDLIIRVGGKLLCQLLGNFIWIALIGLDDFLGWRGLDNMKHAQGAGAREEQATARANTEILAAPE